MKRATIYLEEDIHRALKLKSVEADQTISHLVNDAIRTTLAEDLDDLSDIESRNCPKKTHPAVVSAKRMLANAYNTPADGYINTQPI